MFHRPRIWSFVLTFAFNAALGLGAASLWAAQGSGPTDKPPFRELKTLMCERGKLLLSESFTDEASFKKQWRAPKGKWTFQDEAVTVDEIDSDGHHPYAGTKIDLSNAIVQFSFKFSGARSIFVGFDKPGAHIARCFISPDKFRLTRTTGIGGTTKSTLISEQRFDFEEGRWYTILLEIHGKEMVAQVENRCFAFGQIDGIEIPKTQFQLMTTGKGAWYDELRIWEAKADSAWPRRRAKLAAMKQRRCK